MKPNRLKIKILICILTAGIAAAVLLVLFAGPLFAEQGTSAPAAFKLSVWVAYWDWENGIKDVNAIAGKPDGLLAFAASFDSSDTLFYPEGMTDAEIKNLQSANPGLPVWLSVVNDAQDAGGKWTDKDSGLIDRLMQAEDSRTKHAADIVSLVEQGGFAGAEIDYEKISDQSWPGFCDFCGRLNTALREKGKKLRVVLEPDGPHAQGLPAGPEYVVMAYNLYGSGTKPGPKADEAFIRKLAGKMKSLPGNKSFAFATGGYDWAPDGDAAEVTETQAYGLSQNSKDVKRDGASGDLYFTYQKDGGTHTVWYADSQTLQKWFGISRSLGMGDISLWRLGGTRPDTLQMLRQLKDMK